MSKTTKTSTPFGKYMTFTHTVTLNQTNLHSLERQVELEAELYKEALEEIYDLKGILKVKKRKKAIKTIDEAHEVVIETAKGIVANYDDVYRKIDQEWNEFAPHYRMMSPKTMTKEDKQFNIDEFHRFCNNFASKYGEWFWEIRLRHDPLDDMNFGSATIRELQDYENNSWYPHMEDWRSIPYGARLLEFYLTFWLDLTKCILREKEIYKDFPSKKLYKMIGIESH